MTPDIKRFFQSQTFHIEIVKPNRKFDPRLPRGNPDDYLPEPDLTPDIQDFIDELKLGAKTLDNLEEYNL